MKKKLTYSAAVLGLTAVLTIPLMGFSSEGQGHSKFKPNQITLVSGGTSVPYTQMGDTSPYHQPKDGIISAAAGCQPDLHVFGKNDIAHAPSGAEEPNHIVFTAGIKQFGTHREKAEAFDASGAKVYVEITSDGNKVLEQPLYLHPGVDPNTQKPFYVTAVWLGGTEDAKLATGEYNYLFEAKDQKGKVLDKWAPEDSEFIITDSTANN
jgi:hypothetical protein